MSKSISKLILAGLALSLAVPAGANTQQKATMRHHTNAGVRTLAKPAPEGKRIQLPNDAKVRTLVDKGSRQLAEIGKVRRPLNFKLDRQSAPLRVEGSDAVNGLVIYGDNWAQDYAPCGIYSFPTDGNSNEATEIAVVSDMLGMQAGVAVGDRYYTSVLETFLGIFIVQADVCVFDTNTWELIERKDCVDDITRIAVNYAYDYSSDKIYGQFYSANGGYCFGEFDPETFTVTPIAETAARFNVMAFAPDGTLYTIDMSGNLYTMNVANGELTLIGSTGIATQYLSGGAIDQRTGRFYYCLSSSDDDCSYMYEVNTATAELSLIYQLQYNEEVIGMWVPKPDAEDGAPAKATDVSANFDEGSLSGNLSFKAPVTLFDGTAFSGDFTYVIKVNGEEVKTGTVAAGGDVTFDYTAPASGNYTFTVYFTNEVGDGPSTNIKMYLGVDSPLAPKNVKLTYADSKMTLTWDAAQGAHSGYLGNVTYTITRYETGKEPVVVKEGLTECTYTEEFVPESDDLGNVYYTVAANTEEGATTATESNSVSIGFITPPYSHSFVEDTELTGYTIIDANGDGKAWSMTSGDGLQMTYNSSADMDDWCISPAVKLEAGNYYTYKVVVANNSATYTETVEVKAGKAAVPSAMTIDVIPASDVQTNFANITLTGGFVATETGEYYIGIHGISAANQWNLYVREYSISEGVSALAPAKVSDVEITPNPANYFEANVSFKAPATSIAGEDIVTIDWIEVSRDGELVNKVTSPTPGAEISFVDVVPESATYTYSIIAHGNYGYGLPVEESVYVGVPVPAATEEATVEETATPGEVTITWEPVTTAADGSSLAAEYITYTILNGDNEVVAEGLTDCSYTYQAVTEGQDFVYYLVYAVTAGGKSDVTVTNMIPVGIPYELPFKESFPDRSLTYIWGTESNGGSWSIGDNETFQDVTDADLNNGFAYMNGQSVGASADLFSGLITLNADAPALKFAYYNIAAGDTNEVLVYVTCDGETNRVAEVIMDADGAQEGWNTALVTLKEYAGKTVFVTFRAVSMQYAYTMIDNIVIEQLEDYDMQLVSVNGPAEVKPDETFAITADVLNQGALTMADYKVELYRNGTLKAVQDGVALETGEKATFSFEQVLNVTAGESNLYTVNLVCDLDPNKDDNTLDYPVVLLLNSYPAPRDLKATLTNYGVSLTWNEPDTESEAPVMTVTEDFEAYDAFATGNLGDWTLVDEDGKAMGGVQDIEIPGLVTNESSLAYVVMNDTFDQFNQSFLAHSGNQYLMSMYNADGSASADWLISPLLSGDAQTVTFFAKSYTTQYGGEDIKVLYSTTDNEITSFTEIAEFTNLPAEWTAYSVNLPAGAKHFAIECVSADRFMLFIDDVTYAPAGGEAMELSIVGYNIYRNGVKINDEPVAETDYVDANGTTSDFYCVTAVYTIGESAPSLTVGVGMGTVGVNDIIGGATAVKVAARTIVVTNAQGTVAVYAADGKAVYSEAAAKTNTVTVAPGVYVVKAGETVTKVIVK